MTAAPTNLPWSTSRLKSNLALTAVVRRIVRSWCLPFHWIRRECGTRIARSILPEQELYDHLSLHKVSDEMASSSPSATSRSLANGPVPVPASITTSPPSVISSRMTDIASEVGDEYQPEGLATRQTSTGRVNDSSRPQSPISAQTRQSARAPSSRRGTPFPGTSSTSPGWRSGGAFGGPGGSISNTSRPQSANSRSSRSHVPSLASQAFFHPMSSQRLQAQRGNRPLVFQQTTGFDGYSETGSNINRHSTGSNMTDQRVATAQTGNELPPPSRDTEFTEQDDRLTRTASPTGYGTAQSIGESERPLQAQVANVRPGQLDLGKNYKQSAGVLRPIERSPRSFRASFLIPSRNGVSPRSASHGRQRLGSVPAPPNDADTDTSTQGAPEAGINYEYFDGNTVFCWGGRLQNTRDRPINIATAIIVMLPSALFFAYSYVP